jgi:hypothetical protein
MTLRFHKDIYPPALLEKAAVYFSTIASVTIKRKGLYSFISFDKIAPGYAMEAVKGNYMNYCLILLKQSQ